MNILYFSHSWEALLNSNSSFPTNGWERDSIFSIFPNMYYYFNIMHTKYISSALYLGTYKYPWGTYMLFILLVTHKYAKGIYM